MSHPRDTTQRAMNPANERNPTHNYSAGYYPDQDHPRESTVSQFTLNPERIPFTFNSSVHSQLSHQSLESLPNAQPQYTQMPDYSYQPVSAYPDSTFPHLSLPMNMNTFFFAPATLFRYNTIRTIELKGGIYSIDIPVPDKIIEKAKIDPDLGDEFTKLRYTAVLGDPDEFTDRGYTLKQIEYSRKTEIFVVLTMYNENEKLFLRSFRSVMKNISHLCSKSGAGWGPDGWKKVTVCIVSDGREKINRRTLAILGLMGLYQEGLVKTSINEEQVSAHLFEYTTKLNVDGDAKLKPADIPVQVLFCLKEKNAKKLNSHRWFFNAFGSLLNPNICILIDVGTKPSNNSFYHLWKAFNENPHVGGACGEIYTETGICSTKLLNPLVAAQNFEYKMSNILDKPFESAFGFISVLPGAFSAYRYKALQGAPLRKYFYGEKMEDATFGKANMYLAEDRVLCYELVTKRNESWVLKYVRRARAETDVPDSIPEFIAQRRRWLNGSFFAAVHAQTHWYQIFRSKHSIFRKIFLLFEMLCTHSHSIISSTDLLINLIFNWFALGNMYLIFYFLTDDVVNSTKSPFPKGVGVALFISLRTFYMLSMIIIFLLALGNRPTGTKWLYRLCFLLFAIIMGFMLFTAAWTIYTAVPKTLEEWSQVSNLIIDRPAFRDLVLSFAATYGTYLISSILYFEPWHMITSFGQYLLLLPAFVNILMVYAFCNLHDVSWGTKGSSQTKDVAPVSIENKQGKLVTTTDVPTNKQDIDAMYELYIQSIRVNEHVESQKRDKKTKQEDYFRHFRTWVLIFWVFMNVMLITIMSTEEISGKLGIVRRNGNGTTVQNLYLAVVLWFVAGLSVVRFCGSMVYLFT